MQNYSLNKIYILDCTLRDGGRIIDCQFSYVQIQNLTAALQKANIDFIEIGFLDNSKNLPKTLNSTYFQDIKDTKTYINSQSFYSVFANFGRFNFYSLPKFDKTLPQGIRIGFTYQNFTENLIELQKVFLHVKKLGYTVFMQPLNTPEYNNKDFLQLLNFANEIKPYSFAIVDTFGSMFEEDLENYFTLIKQNLDQDINLDFHSHNNLQLSFAHAIWLTKHNTNRTLIIDATLHGMGRGGGNLNSELIAQYLNKNHQANFNIRTLINAINTEILPIKKQINWGYSIPAFLGGNYKIHPQKLELFYKEYLNGKN